MSRELIDRLFAVARDPKEGLRVMRRLTEALGSPQKQFPVVHVAGTNGKGSVTTKIAASFRHAGLYTSPHLHTFRERIRVGGKMISEDDLEKGLEHLFAICEERNIPPNFFELATALAFLHFAQEKVDIAVLETGLGGRLDATNVVDPKLTVITSIGMDHSEVLGETLEAIAAEKGGIVKPGVPCILGPGAQGYGIEEICKDLASPAILVEPCGLSFIEENRKIAQVALEYLQAPTTGLDALPPCRFEQIGRVIFDVAHNAHGLEALLRQLGDRPVRFAVAFSKDRRSAVEGLQVLAASKAPVHLLEVPHSRMLKLEQLCDLFPGRAAQPSGRIDQVLPWIVNHFQETVVVCGSCYLMDSAFAALKIRRFLQDY
ncbi:MAG: bifunctional folylpolyglutamate synthase/dihydrofolate synthase [Verrucomicrobia bacterium]|nr:bifunctional folylpolyglutamate synthase/dihydrofolate synthase [Verrucomicrobiota bacterium]